MEEKTAVEGFGKKILHLYGMNATVSVWRDKDCWTYFVGMQPVYRHGSSDLCQFRLTIAQLIDSGCCRPCEIIRTFGISKSHVDRVTRLYREQGAGGFFTDRSKKKRKSGGTVMTEVVKS
ncbi:MAG: helix-turn-helix domain-containing protein [Opitutales bacterium]